MFASYNDTMNMMNSFVEIVIIIAVFGGLFSIVFFPLRAIIKNVNLKRNQHNYQQLLYNRAIQIGAEKYETLWLTDGLPYVENTHCVLYVTPNHLCIDVNNETYNIDVKQIIAAQAKTDIQIRSEISSSVGQALVGGLLFGAIGAVIGGRVQTNHHSTPIHYLIINYRNKDNDISVLAFTGGTVSYGCTKMAQALSSKINPLRRGSVTNL